MYRMKNRRVLLFIGIYLSVLLSIPLFFHPQWLTDYPDITLEKDRADFSGERAYEQLETLVAQFPSREIGTENARLSALWVARHLQELGLETRLEEFDVRRPRLDAGNGPINPLTVSYLTLTDVAVGVNVVGISPGRRPEIILIGAHRDVIATLQGAEDNGTGTASMLELARVLTKEPHEYTYYFLSFDAEEIGLVGSHDFAARHPNLPIKLAVILDMTGYREADGIGFYQYATGRGAVPLWTHALADAVLKEQGLPRYYFNEADPERMGAFSLFSKAFRQRVSGMVNTDSGPFVDRGIPTIGLMAAYEGEEIFRPGQNGRQIHNHRDVIDQVSADTLEMVGGFAERYIRNVDAVTPTMVLNSRSYILTGNQFLSPWALRGFYLLFVLLAGLLLSISVKGSLPHFEGVRSFFGREWRYLLPVTAAAVLLLIGFLVGESLFYRLPIFPALLGYGLLLIITSVAVLVVRLRSFKGRVGIYREVTSGQHLLLNGLYSGLFVLTMVLLSPIPAILLFAYPLLVLGRIGYKTMASRVLSILLYLLSFVVQGAVLVAMMQSYVFEMMHWQFGYILFIHILLAMLSLVYLISTPPFVRVEGREG